MQVANRKRTGSTPLDRDCLGIFGYLNMLLLLTTIITGIGWYHAKQSATVKANMDMIDQDLALNSEVVKENLKTIRQKMESYDDNINLIKLKAEENQKLNIKLQKALLDISEQTSARDSRIQTDINGLISDLRLIKDGIHTSNTYSLDMERRIVKLSKHFETNMFITTPYKDLDSRLIDDDRF